MKSYFLRGIERKRMKDRMDIIRVFLSLLLTCVFVCGGCHPIGYIFEVPVEVDAGSALLQPTFCTYPGLYSRKRPDIKSLTVWKVPLAPDQKRWEFGSYRWKVPPSPDDKAWTFWDTRQKVWHVEYKASANFMKRLFGWQPSTVSCLTYGEVPPGYQADVKAEPLAPEQFYSVEIRADDGTPAADVNFIIRLDENSTPERLEYHQRTSLTHPSHGRALKYKDAPKLY